MESDRLRQYRLHTFDNELEILRSGEAVCLSCLSRFSARKVADWEAGGKGESALCPVCGMRAVVGDASGLSLESKDVEEAHAAIYGSAEASPVGKKEQEQFISDFMDGKISDTGENEKLWLTYVERKAQSGDPDDLLFFGCALLTEFEAVKPDYARAKGVFEEDARLMDERAFRMLGIMYLDPDYEMVDYGKARECIEKAVSLGDGIACLVLADMFLYGLEMAPDPEFAYASYSNFFVHDYRPLVVGDVQKGYDYAATLFGHAAYRLGRFELSGISYEPDEFEALRYFLLAKFALDRTAEFSDPGTVLLDDWRDSKDRIKELSAKFSLVRGMPTYDQYTFRDSFEHSPEYPISNRLDGFEITDIAYDEESATLSFKAAASGLNKCLILDASNLFCDYVEGEISWKFVDVKSVRLPEAKDISVATIGCGDDSIVFFGCDGKGIIMEVEFQEDGEENDTHVRKA